jgi:heme-degrading monooxygenase HmoA
MTEYDGYLDRELLIDPDDPGHLLVVSRWESRESRWPNWDCRGARPERAAG